jgi:hypothetical protein
MAGSKGWVARLLRWFRGDDLDDLLGRDREPMLSGAIGEAAEGAVSGAEAAALTGTATAVLEPPARGGIRRTFIDEEGAPDTVDEDYILSRGEDGDEAVGSGVDQVEGDSDGVTLSRVPPRPEEVILAKVDEGVGEVTQALTSINTAVVQQGEVAERLAKSLSELPAAVRAQGVYLETLTRQLEAQNARSAELAGRLKDLPALLSSLPEQGREQLEFLQQIAAVIEGQADHSNTLADRVSDVYATLQGINDSGRSQVRVLQDVDRTQRALLDAVKQSSQVGAKRYAWLIGLMWTVTVVTVGGIAFVVYWLTRHLPTG